jgi:hypothetical protein
MIGKNGPNEYESPIGEQADKSDVNRHFDDGRVELAITERFSMLFGHRSCPEKLALY